MTSTELLARALDVGLRAADAARAAIMDRYTRGFSVETKADQSPVTEADREAEAAIRRIILAEFPEHRIVGEELGSEGAGELSWLVDPIDGTISFVHRVPLFATLIALCRGGEPVMAVVDLPALGRRFHALAGGGAWEGSRRLRVADTFDPADSLVCHGNRLQFEHAGRMDWYERLNREVRLFRSYTDAFGHCLVACGSAALMVDPDLRPWDSAAPALLVQEAGGRVLHLPEPPLGDRATVIAGTPAALTWAERRLITN
jgi:histidinol-phosphatase